MEKRTCPCDVHVYDTRDHSTFTSMTIVRLLTPWVIKQLKFKPDSTKLIRIFDVECVS